MLLWYCTIAGVESVCVMSVRAAQLAVVLCIYRPFGCHWVYYTAWEVITISSHGDFVDKHTS